MYCNNCGTEIKENEKFCSNCGQKSGVKKLEQKESQNEGLGIASMVIGIISIILSLILNILIIIIPIIGLILGIINKAKGGKKISGIILNIISIVLSIVLFIFFFIMGISLISNFMDSELLSNPVSGNYNCASFDGRGASKDYIVRLELNNNETFLWGKYNDTSNNYVKGFYTYKDLDKKNASGEYSYYSVSLNGDVFYQDGIKQTDPYKSDYEFGITKQNGKKQGIIMNTKTYNMYYCYEE